MEDRVKGTRVAAVNGANSDVESIRQAAAVLREGGLVAFPTETVYGLGANALNSDAVARIFAAKGRPADNPLIVHIADSSAITTVASSVPRKAELLMTAFWPGPLTLVLPRQAVVPDNVTGGLTAVGVRMPNHPVALQLIRSAGVPIAAPSANLSGRPSPTSADHVLEDLAGRIDFLLDGGETGVGLESTVVDLTVEPPVLLRPGGVTLEEIEEVIGSIAIDPGVNSSAVTDAPRSPGMKYKHYAPKATVIVVTGPVLLMQAKILDLAYEYQEEGQRVGVMCATESHGVYPVSVVLEYGSRDDLQGIGQDLFSTLRAFDRHEVDVILAEGVGTKGIGMAIMNRLRRAAGGRVVDL